MSKFLVMVFEVKDDDKAFKRSMMAAGGKVTWEGDHDPLVIVREPRDKEARLEDDPRRSRPL